MNSKYLFFLGILLSLLVFQTCEKSPSLEDFYKDQKDKRDSLTVKVPATPTLFQTQFIEKINAKRADGCKCGDQWMPSSGPLKWNRYLEAAGLIHAIEMNENDYFSHYSLNGGSPGDRVSKVGYLWLKVGENLEKGDASMDDIIDAFIKSENHCKVMFDGNYTELGIGVNGPYKVFDFAKPKK